jgi:hypothetical protein
MSELDAVGAVAAYARGCLAVARYDRDWMRDAVTRLEASGERIVLTEQPATDGGPWTVLDWRTGVTLAAITGGQDDYEAAWRPGWTDVCRIGAWLEGLDEDGQPGTDWPEILPPPPPAAPEPAPLALLLPDSLADRLEEAIEAWAVAAGVVSGRAAQVAELTGWTEDKVLACTASWLAITGDQYMRLGDAGPGEAVT